MSDQEVRETHTYKYGLDEWKLLIVLRGTLNGRVADFRSINFIGTYLYPVSTMTQNIPTYVPTVVSADPSGKEA